MESNRRSLMLAALAAPAMVGFAASVAAAEAQQKGKTLVNATTQKDEPEATPPWDAASVNLASKEMVPGVFAVLPDDVFAKDHVATTGGFVIGERSVLVVEAMLNGDLASQVIGLVRKETSKPIRFLVNTSYHGDHAYGNYVFPGSTVVIQHPATKRYLEEKFEDDRRFMLGLMGHGKGIEHVQSRSADITVSEMTSIDLGGRTVEIRHFGFAQTPGDLVIWTPDAKVLWVGNMIQAPSPALPWLLEGRHRDTIETLTKVRDFLPKDATIIPGYGHPMRPADIDFSIQYLRELDTAVSAAIAKGLSLKATLKVVGMPSIENTACSTGCTTRSTCPLCTTPFSSFPSREWSDTHGNTRNSDRLRGRTRARMGSGKALRD